MGPERYRLVIKGELGERYASAFEGMTVSPHDGVTDITGRITDRSHLQGLLDRIAALGLTLHSLTPLEAENGEGRGAPSSARTSNGARPPRRRSSPDSPHAGRNHPH